MLDEEFILSLPEDPDTALGILYSKLKTDLFSEQEIAMSSNAETAFDLESARRTFLNLIFAFLSAHDLLPSLESVAPNNSEQFSFYFQETTTALEFYIAKTSFKRAGKTNSGTTATYLLSPELKAKIHRSLGIIRELIADSTLSESKRAALSKKLNVFADEVDRNRTRVEALAAAMIWTRKEIVEGAQGLEPIVEKLDKMFQSFTKATEFLRFPSTTEQKQIPAPPKRIEGPKRDLDEEIPF
jgi:hypothetical protein